MANDHKNDQLFTNVWNSPYEICITERHTPECDLIRGVKPDPVLNWIPASGNARYIDSGRY